MTDVLVGVGRVVEPLASHDVLLLETDSATPELNDQEETIYVNVPKVLCTKSLYSNTATKSKSNQAQHNDLCSHSYI